MELKLIDALATTGFQSYNALNSPTWRINFESKMKKLTLQRHALIRGLVFILCWRKKWIFLIKIKQMHPKRGSNPK